MLAVPPVKAHAQAETHRYQVHFPEHEARESDPHHADFAEYKRRRKEAGTWYCDFAHQYRDDTSECDLSGPLECHHAVIEFALANGVNLARLEKWYPGVSQEGIGAWLDQAQNLILLCRWHHRGHGGVHVLSASDYEAYKFVEGLIS